MLLDIFQGGTLIEISPVLLFSPEEYQVHGKHTKLDTYTFLWRWENGEKAWALALGLGTCSSARISMTLLFMPPRITFQPFQDAEYILYSGL